MARYIHIFILTLIGFFMTPTLAYACGKTTESTQISCSKDKSLKFSNDNCTQNKSCCAYKQHKKCGGNCKHNSCKCCTTVSSFSLPAFITFSSKQIFVETKKQKFGFKQTYYSSDISSIWQPPKIS